jgi:hypothetical protein
MCLAAVVAASCQMWNDHRHEIYTAHHERRIMQCAIDTGSGYIVTMSTDIGVISGEWVPPSVYCKFLCPLTVLVLHIVLLARTLMETAILMRAWNSIAGRSAHYAKIALIRVVAIRMRPSSQWQLAGYHELSWNLFVYTCHCRRAKFSIETEIELFQKKLWKHTL